MVLVISFNWALETGIVIAMDLVYQTKPLGKLLKASRNVHLLMGLDSLFPGLMLQLPSHSVQAEVVSHLGKAHKESKTKIMTQEVLETLDLVSLVKTCIKVCLFLTQVSSVFAYARAAPV